MNKIIMHKRTLWTIALLAIMASAIAIAELPCGGGGMTNIAVDDADLDLSEYSELFTLYQRLQNAAMQACHPDGQRKVLPIYGLADRGDCYSDTLKSALIAYGSSALDNIHDDILHPPILVGFD